MLGELLRLIRDTTTTVVLQKIAVAIAPGGAGSRRHHRRAPRRRGQRVGIVGHAVSRAVQHGTEPRRPYGPWRRRRVH